MRLEFQILAAVVLDLVLGDPRWWPHPVRLIAALALRLEKFTRWAIPSPRFAGVVTALATCAAAGGAVWGLIYLAGLAHPWAVDAVGIIAIYTTIAARDLAGHAHAVYRPLRRGEIAQARAAVGRIVGRDTNSLDESGVARAAVESVAESTVDGVTAPLFWATVAGPVGAIVYRAINTLDSTFGYTDERYLRFGWASARIDDVANYIPARLTGAVMCVAAFLLRQRPVQAFRVMLADARKHASPNAGWPEAAVAGALGVQLGGPSQYHGEWVDKPTMGSASIALTAKHIRTAVVMMFAAEAIFLAICLPARAGVVYAWNCWRAGA